MSEEWSVDPEGVCFFCKKTVPVGYALRDSNGVFQQACWPCAKKQIKEESNVQDRNQKA